MMNLLETTIYTPLKEGHYKTIIEKVGINEVPTEDLKALGFYAKNMPEGKNNEYIRLDLLTEEGKRINRNVFAENLNVVFSNIKRQLNLEEDMAVLDILKYCLQNKAVLDMWVWYNESNKNVDFYDAIASRDQQNTVNEQILNNLIA